MYFFIGGSKDPEMLETRRVLTEQGFPFAHATIRGLPVKSCEAYQATGIEGLIPRNHKIVFIECAVIGLLPDEVCDHHNEGDPGYELPPERYLEGSSLGQVLKLLGLEPTPQQRIIAAADHCLAAAYRGQCPGVDPEELAAWRERSRAEARGITPEEIRKKIQIAMDALRAAPRVKVGNQEVAWFSFGDMPEEVPEASARLGIPFAYVRNEDGRRKAGIMGAEPDVIREWMAVASKAGLKDIYGVPARGFAGGYAR